MNVDGELGQLRDVLLGKGPEEDVVSEWAADQRTANAAVTMRGMGGGEVETAVPHRRRLAEGTGSMRAYVPSDAPVIARGSSIDLHIELDEDTLDLDLDIADGVGLELDGGDAIEPSASSKRVRRRTKRSRPRSKTIAMKRVTRAELQAGALMYPPVVDMDRPKTRAECKQEARPCPWVSCKHHLYLDINPETGSIKINFPDLEPWEMAQTCSLDVADEGALTLEEIGVITNLTRERIRQLEVRGLFKLKGRREIR